MQSSTRIKVSDLLMYVGETDSIHFDAIVLNSIDGLGSQGIAWTIHLQSIDNSTLIATLENVICVIDDVSDISGTAFQRSVKVDSLSAYFVLLSRMDGFNQEDDSSVFPIDEKSMFIDIEDFLYESIGLQTPFIKRTPKEEKIYMDINEDGLDDIDDPALGGGVVFRKAKGS